MKIYFVPNVVFPILLNLGFLQQKLPKLTFKCKLLYLNTTLLEKNIVNASKTGVSVTLMRQRKGKKSKEKEKESK